MGPEEAVPERSPTSLVLSCGEASGDAYVGFLARELRVQWFQGKLWGMCGALGEAAGVEPRWRSEALQLMGISEVLPALPRLWRLQREMLHVICEARPAGVVLVDAPDFHLPLARRLRRRGYGGKLFSLAPPTVWAWRPGRVKTLRLFSRIFPLFPFEATFLHSQGVRTAFRGHPLLDDPALAPCDRRAPLRRVALLPGSRPSEVRRLGEVLGRVGQRLQSRGLEPVLSLAPSLGAHDQEWLRRMAGSLPVAEGAGAELMKRCDLVVGACGTAAVEALLLQRFMVVLYRSSWSSALVYHLLVNTPFVALPNLLLDHPIYPELLQEDVREDRILEEIFRYVDDPLRQRALDQDLREGRKRLGDPGAVAFWAHTVRDELHFREEGEA